MNEDQNLPLISLEEILKILSDLNIHYSLEKDDSVVKTFPSDFSISSSSKKKDSTIFKFENNYTLHIIDQNNLLLKEKVRNARHDIYNLINTSLLGLDYIKSKFSLKNDIHRCEVLEKNLNSVTSLLETVFDETKERPKEQFLLNKILVDLARIFSTAISKEKTFIYSISDSEFYLNGNKEDIFNSILNLLINADEATEDDGIIKLSLQISEKAAIIVEDNGSGISVENIHNIFDHGFSTKNKEHESGIGLYNVKNIVEAHDGNIIVESEKNIFTRFQITFNQSVKHEQKDSNKTILFADDDEMLLELIYDLLSSYDFNIITVKNGIELIDSFNEEIDLVIADRNMPNLDGISAVKKIRVIDPITPVIISTGFTKDESEVDTLKEFKNIHFIDKPYNFERLLNLINSII